MNIFTKKKKYALKNRARFFTFLFSVSLIAFIIVYTASVSGYAEPSYQKVTVRSGDSLWSIAREYCDDRHDIREYIYNVRKINNMDSSLLMADTTLLIPVEE
ncbi:cell division suppressor protein YneA [Ruminiclostridium hungatei]|uniref:Cell division suppressor protein YneA n=1 Tax=Ruminiclostridium hungatei TaxID=48256 RepID=A0A1V4SJP3_RUMHU|nr:LysM peptidoglycan-binding domain-containing protein [Ruminiclostridium hungatei]OPX43716.1 cell division suppressor protein YneA [Ruminiclostridium hungatei]